MAAGVFDFPFWKTILCVEDCLITFIFEILVVLLISVFISLQSLFKYVVNK